MEFPLTKDQSSKFDLIESSTDNVLLVGKPGTGKSVLSRALISEGNKSYTVAAPTGLAALNIGGKTLHSLFQIPSSQGIIHPDYNKFTINDNVLNNLRYRVNQILIDEVSMVRADMFDYIDRLLRMVKGVAQPFGGIQMILVGDFYQLPPVVVGTEKIQLRDYGYESPFIFSSKAFESFKIKELTEVLRQKGDKRFIEILDSARTGDMTTKQIALLNKQVGRPDDVRISLTGTNKLADEINLAHMATIDSKAYQFVGESYGDWPQLPVQGNLTLKVGAQVMVKKNGSDYHMDDTGPKSKSTIVNGTLGKIIEFNEKDKTVIIETDRGEVRPIFTQRWEHKVKVKVDNEWDEKVVASYQQMPLTPAWAISIHKSQGQTFEKAHIDTTKIFAGGQLYVAISRVKSLEGISLAQPLSAAKFFADKAVTKFFNSIEV